MIAKIMYLSSLLTILGLLRPVSGDYYSVLADVSYTCQNRVSGCIANSAEVKALVDNQSYCDALKYSSLSFNSTTCLVTNGGCLDSEYTIMYREACSTQGAIGVVTVTLQCQKMAEKCLAKSPAALELFLKKQYCAALLYNTSPYDSKACLLGNGGCTESEYINVKDSVCSATSVMAGMTTLFFCILVYMLN
ncbi:hypothetical protein Bpfe_007797 [Biomphalaria pfeifferi]|uniref:Uncharacterized protein n=1 Tax=Biomphalaria pfeifferi TaxID=112525 RepID=A0AAD8BXE8_BIOPF|nr:hypothetical protein Bpfe_007797 [Biomphalaria pfeifferi]